MKYKMYKGGNITYQSGKVVTEKEFKEIWQEAVNGLAVLCGSEYQGNFYTSSVDNIIRMKDEFGIESDDNEEILTQYVIKYAEREEEYKRINQLNVEEMQAKIDYLMIMEA